MIKKYVVRLSDAERKLVREIDFRYTPKHGSWLNIAENELSSMTRQASSICRHWRVA